MDLKTVNTEIIDRAFQTVLPGSMLNKRSRVMLLAIGLQESRFEHRRQIRGPAVGFWQFERGGGVKGVLTHGAVRGIAENVCKARMVAPSAQAVYEQLPTDDILACAFARLLLYTDPRPLPELDDVQGAWDYYVRNWRPGKPHRQTWDALYAQARAAV